MRRVIGIGLLAGFMAASGMAQLPGYDCPGTCLPPNCLCPSADPPGSLSPTNTPQIILLTFDDAVESTAYASVQQVLTNHWNPNGSPIQATFYVTSYWTDFPLIHNLHAQGHEIALHTMSHSTSVDTELATWRAEIVGSRKTVATLAQIPEEEIVGFRAPFLNYNNDSFAILHEQGFLYDASVLEQPGALSADATSFIWPYTLDYGLAQYALSGGEITNTFPGLFEVPMWSLLDTNNNAVALMDPAGTHEEIRTLLERNFLHHYTGNRAPFGLFLHAPWLEESGTRHELLNDFIEWALAHDDVWFVSTADLVAYMRDPRDAASVGAFPPFITQTHPDWPTGQVSTCAYEAGHFQACTSCPTVYPMPTNLYTVPVPMAGGGVLDVRTTAQSAENFWGTVTVSNDTPVEVADYQIMFEVHGGVVTGASAGALVAPGVTPVFQAGAWQKPLHTGELETVYFGGDRVGVDPVTFSDAEVTLYTLEPQRPEILGFHSHSNGQWVLEWDDSALGYAVEWGTDSPIGAWSGQTGVYGRTAWTSDLPAASGFLRVKGLR